QFWQFKSLSASASPLPSDRRGIKGEGHSKFKVQSSKFDVRSSSSAPSSILHPPPQQLPLLPPQPLARLPSVPLTEPDRLQRLRWEAELLGYPVSGHPLELYPDIACDTYCPVNRLGDHL